jgi:hypothetical protein
MKKRLDEQLMSQLFTSAVSAGLIIGLIELDHPYSNNWSFSYSVVMLVLVVIRSIFSEPLLYVNSNGFSFRRLRNVLCWTSATSACITFLLFVFSRDIHTFFLLIPSIVNAVQDFTRYSLLKIDLKTQLAKSDGFWLISASLAFIVAKNLNQNYATLFFICSWCIFGVASIFYNILYLKKFQGEFDKPSIQSNTLKLSLLIDKILPRITSESQYLLLNFFTPLFMTEYRIANLLMGFTNVFVMTEMIYWVKDDEAKIRFRQTVLPIVFINLIISATFYLYSRNLIALCMIGLTIGVFIDLKVTKKITEYRKKGEEFIKKSAWIRSISCSLVLIGFFFTLQINAADYAVASAAMIGSLFSLLVLKFFK